MNDQYNYHQLAEAMMLVDNQIRGKYELQVQIQLQVSLWTLYIAQVDEDLDEATQLMALKAWRDITSGQRNPRTRLQDAVRSMIERLTGDTDLASRMVEASQWLNEVNDQVVTRAALALQSAMAVKHSRNQDLDEIAEDWKAAVFDQLDAYEARAREDSNPTWLNELLHEILIVRLEQLDPAERAISLYDPTIGTGSALASLSRSLVHDYDVTPTVAGQDINAAVLVTAALRLTALGIKHANLVLGDTLTQPGHLTPDARLQTFDVTLCTPPLGLRLARERRNNTFSDDPFQRFPFETPGWTADTAFLQHALSSTKPGGLTIAQVPPRLLHTSRDEPLRQALTQSGMLEAVILLPGGFAQGTMLATALLILTPAPRHDDVLLINANHHPRIRPRDQRRAATLATEIARLYAERSATPGWSALVTKETIRSRQYNLSPAPYITPPDARDDLPTRDELKVQTISSFEAIKQAHAALQQLLEDLEHRP